MANTELGSPLSPGWAERHADACNFILDTADDVIHSHTVEELVHDYIRMDKSYRTLRTYRKIDFVAFDASINRGPWIILSGLRHKAVICDRPESVLDWFPRTTEASDEKVRLYEAIDILPKVRAIYAEQERKAAEERKRKTERKHGENIAKVLRAVRGGNESVEEIALATYGLCESEVERIVQELIALGELEIVDWQPPVQKLIKVKQHG